MIYMDLMYPIIQFHYILSQFNHVIQDTEHNDVANNFTL